jgi:hypothetical protein
VATLPFSDVYDHVAPYLIGADTPIIDFHIRRTAREFLRQTCLWREQVAQFNVVVDQPAYVLNTTDPTAEVCNIMSVVLDGRRLGVMSDRDLTAYGVEATASFPRGWLKRGPRILRFSDPPKDTFPCNVEVALTLALDPGVTELPDFLVHEYNDVFTDGVKGNAMLVPGKPWTSPEAGEMFTRRFHRGILALRAEFNDGGKIHTHQFSGPRFGA